MSLKLGIPNFSFKHKQSNQKQLPKQLFKKCILYPKQERNTKNQNNRCRNMNFKQETTQEMRTQYNSNMKKPCKIQKKCKILEMNCFRIQKLYFLAYKKENEELHQRNKELMVELERQKPNQTQLTQVSMSKYSTIENLSSIPKKVKQYHSFHTHVTPQKSLKASHQNLLKQEKLKQRKKSVPIKKNTFI
ncbi:hypothetical protein pb186bvf_007034 [Paramecium bursaria]